MRILEICNHFPPTIGGSETHNFSIVKYLHDKGHDVEVIAVRGLQGFEKLNYYNEIKDSLLSNEFIHPDLPGIHIHNVILKQHKFPYNYICYYNIWKKVQQIEKKRGRFDLIETHFLPFALFLSGKRRIVLTVHSFMVVCVKYNSPAQCHRPAFGRCKCVSLIRYIYWRLINVICMHKVDKIIVKYDYMGKNIAKRKIPGSKIATIPHWIDYEALQKPIAQNVNKSEVFTYGFLGRLDEFKGIRSIIHAFKIVLDGKIKARMLIIGDGLLKKELEEYCRQNNILEYVNFVGNIDHHQLSNYLPLADSFVVASPYDNYNWALIELMCSGKPIIATRTGGTCDILIDGYNAILADPTPESIAEKMKYVLENYDSIKQIPENALQTIKEKHSMDNLKLYESLLMEVAKK